MRAYLMIVPMPCYYIITMLCIVLQSLFFRDNFRNFVEWFSTTVIIRAHSGIVKVSLFQEYISEAVGQPCLGDCRDLKSNYNYKQLSNSNCM